jgi:peptidoglycan/LPS O-acetylase OafA/YrhL
MKTFGKTKYITGLKALGALMIVVGHLHYQFSSFPDLVYKIVSFAGNFIVLFFCISAYTVAMSIDRTKQFKLIPFMIKRWIRLAPAYYVMIVVGLGAQVAIHHWSFVSGTLRDLFLHVTFLNLNLIWEPSQSSLLGFEWTIPILFWFYPVTALLLYLIRRRFFLFTAVFALGVYLHFHLNAIITYHGMMSNSRSMQVWIVMYVYTLFIYQLQKNTDSIFPRNKKFIMTMLRVICSIVPFGILLTNIQTTSERTYALGLIVLTCYLLWGKRYVLSAITGFPRAVRVCIDNIDTVILLVVLGKYVLNLYFIKDSLIIMCLWFNALLLAGAGKPLILRVFLENRFMNFIGTISFGIYLNHNLAITAIGYIVPPQYSMLRVLCILALSFSTAFLLYQSIEQPIKKILFNKFHVA